MSANSASTLYGKGVFTTLAVFDGGPFLWEKHWRRIMANAQRIGLDITTYTEDVVIVSIKNELVGKNLNNGRVRITFADDSSSLIWPRESSNSTTLSIITGGIRDVPDDFKLTVSPYPINSRSPLAGVKSCNYLENLMTVEEAKTRGFHEAVRVNERGDVTSAAMANLFWLKDGVLFTPSLATGCLAGTTREFVLENLDCREVEVGIKELNSAESIYLTSAGLGIVSVAEFDGRKLDDPPHQITQLITVG